MGRVRALFLVLSLALIYGRTSYRSLSSRTARGRSAVGSRDSGDSGTSPGQGTGKRVSSLSRSVSISITGGIGGGHTAD